MSSQPLALPERLRPRPVRRRSRRRPTLLLVLLLCLLLPLPWWRLQRVEVTPCPGLPEVVRQELSDLAGTSPLALDLQWVRRQMEVWPGVAGVKVQLELPGSLYVTVRPAEVVGSVVIGQSWHGITGDGSFGCLLDEPQLPLLEGFGWAPAELRRGLAVAARVRQATGMTVGRARQVMPGDTELSLQVGTTQAPVMIRVDADATEAERIWCDQVRQGWQPAPWTDLRWQDRMVVREQADE
jgi:cell division septal protein FtsQ